MPLIVRRGKPPIVPLEIGGGAVIRLRPATSEEVDEAKQRVIDQLALVKAGRMELDSIRAIAPEFDFGDLPDEAKVEALRQRLLLTDLIMVCSDGWHDVLDEGRSALEFHKGSVALLLSDAIIAGLCAERVYSRVHLEALEKKE